MQHDNVFHSALHPHEGQQKFMLSGLDGLRAIAVILVVVYHLWPQALPGGMIGVDLFFVISGYLITALLLREGAYTGKMDIVTFWVRRLRRLLPALILLTLVVAPLALIIGGDVQVGLGRQILGAFTYSSNWLLIGAGNDYFAQTSPELMTNFWSLAVEEQFYFFWPVIMVFVFMFTGRWWQRATVPAVLGLFSLSLAALLTALGVSATRIYYGTDTHLYGLMLGVLLAMLVPWSMYPPADQRLYPFLGYGNGIWGWLRQGLGWLSLALVLPLALNLNELTPGLLMPWGLFGGALLGLGVIQALLPDVRGGSSGVFRALLCLAPLRWVGQRSYGIYLWHWPLLVLAHYAFGPGHSPWVSAGVLLLTLLAAGLSYMFVEQPVRQLGFRGALESWLKAATGNRGRALPLAAAAGLCLTLVATVFAVRTAPQMTQAEAVVAAGAAAQASTKPDQQEHQAPTTDPTESTPAETAPAEPEASSSAAPAPSPGGLTDGSGVTIVGDSVTLASSAALSDLMPQAQINAEVSRNTSQAIPLAEELADKGQLGSVLVLSVTANSTITAQSLETLKAQVSPDGQRKIVLVTGQGPANLSWIEPSNRVIRDFAAAHPKDVFVADWQKASAGHPDYLVSDGVHPQNQGTEVYAQTVQKAVAQAEESLQEARN